MDELINETIVQEEKDVVLTSSKVDIFNLIVAIVGIVGNLSTCIIIIKNKKFHKMTFYFILNLAIADLLTCMVFTFVNFIVGRLENSLKASDTVRGLIYCKLIAEPHSISLLFSQGSVYCLVSIAIERYVSLTSLNRVGGPRQLSRIWAGIVMALPWMLAFGYIILLTTYITVEKGKCATSFNSHSIDTTSGVIFIFANYLIPSIIMVLLYGRVVYTLKKQASGHKMVRTSIDDTRKRITIILIVVTAGFMVLRCPDSIGSLIFFTSDIDHNYLIIEILPYLYAIANINSVINPFLYYMGYHKFKVAYKQLFFYPIFRVIGQNKTSNYPLATITPKEPV